MGRRLDDIFNECYERVRSGETIESVLASYPEHTDELERLLRTAFDIGRRGSYIQPRPEFRHWTGVRLQGAFEYARRQKQKPTARGFNWSTAWAVALTALVIVVVSGISTAAAASNAMPDGALYPVKLATEQARLALTFSESAKAELYAKYAERRVIEIETMAEQGKPELAAATAEKLASHLDSASTAITKATEVPQAAPPVTTSVAEPTPTAGETAVQEPTSTIPSQPAPQQAPPQETATTASTPPTETTEKVAPEKTTKAEKAERVRTALENSTSRSLTALQKAMDRASPETKDRLQKAMDRLSEKGYRKPEYKHGPESWRQDDDNKKEQEGDDNYSAIPEQQTSSSSVDKSSNASKSSDNNLTPSRQQYRPRNRSQ